MKKNTLNSLVILVLIALTVACKSRKIPVKNVPEPVSIPALSPEKAEKIISLKNKDIAYNTLSLRAKADLNINGRENTVNMNIRIARDQKIWISITAIAGIEVARALITPDSLLLLNRLQATAMKKPFNYIHKFANKAVNFKMLQSILTNNTIGDFMSPQAELETHGGNILLHGDIDNLAYKVLFSTLMKTSEINMNDVKAGQALTVIYSDYQQINEAIFPSVAKVNSMSGKNKIAIAFEFSKIERNVQFDFSFTVPKRFEIIN